MNLLKDHIIGTAKEEVLNQLNLLPGSNMQESFE